MQKHISHDQGEDVITTILIEIRPMLTIRFVLPVLDLQLKAQIQLNQKKAHELWILQNISQDQEDDVITTILIETRPMLTEAIANKKE